MRDHSLMVTHPIQVSGVPSFVGKGFGSGKATPHFVSCSCSLMRIATL